MPHEGHLTHFRRAIHKNKRFNQSILHVSVNEAHVIASAGMPGDNGESATWPAYNGFDSFQVLLSNSTSFLALSATVNPYVKTVISKKLALCSNTVKLCSSSNRPNMTYATIDVVDSLANFNNLNFLVLQSYYPPMLQQPTIVFFNTQNMVCNISTHDIQQRFKNFASVGTITVACQQNIFNKLTMTSFQNLVIAWYYVLQGARLP